MAQQRKAGRRKVSNLLALSLLTLLMMERPMYPYEMAAVLRERGKDQSRKINWGSLYTVVQNLEKHGFIEAVEVAREGRQPERTTYQITDAGRAEAEWVRGLLKEFTDGTFPGINAWRHFHATGEIPQDVLALVEGQREGAPDS